MFCKQKTSPSFRWLSAGPCITNVFATRRKNFSQWYRSFQRKLLSHWLKFLRHVAITLVIQGPVLQNLHYKHTHCSHALSHRSATARLVSLGGDNENEGRLEVNSPSHGWGTVCDDDFEESEAQVACRMLGLYGGEVLWTEFDSDGSGTIGLAGVSCDGTEATLFDCQHNDWGNNNCNHFQDVAIRCG